MTRPVGISVSRQAASRREEAASGTAEPPITAAEASHQASQPSEKPASLIGLFAEEPELVDEICRMAMEDRAMRKTEDFRTVPMTRQIRDRIYEETRDMTDDELVRYFRDKGKTVQRTAQTDEARPGPQPSA